jgi:hypothetical protein
MKKQLENREYNFPDADLYAQCMERLKYAKRDITVFISYAYTEAKMKIFEDMCKEFAELPNDDELVGEQMEATQRKNDVRELLKTAIRTVMTRVESLYPTHSGKYRKFGTVKINEMTDPQLLLCARRVVRVAYSLIDILSEFGLRLTHLDKVHETVTAFELSLNVQMDKVADRDISVEKRVEMGNRMYKEMILLSNIGKDIWVEKDLHKYQNYVIYESNNEQKKVRKSKLKQAAETKNTADTSK